ncbi:DUF4365 domain-containing protein [Rhizohabitans arisaemae]|uniref:DUF4365 domain-containing protein n=1 Tax=Rhizohabitans arisaemae TaxID=2720610 RepID=UPI0024B1968C|nr:DUF4365 domain-containing protein [Rhizohabitans arisaemae]
MALGPEERLGRYGEAFVTAIAESAGLTVLSKRPADFYLVDLEIGHPGPRGRMRTPILNVQVKCTQNAVVTDNLVQYKIKARYYNDYVRPCHEFGNPIFVVVVVAPKEFENWADVSRDRLVLREAAYWTCLHGEKPSSSSGDSKVRVTWQRDDEHLLDKKTLLAMFDHAERMRYSREGVFQV